MRIGVTGHQILDGNSARWVRSEIQNELNNDGNLEGISCLASGADQIFAKIVLHLGGVLTAVLPFKEYEETFADPQSLEEFTRLLASATEVEVLARNGSDEKCYFAAGCRVVDRSEMIVAVWDGKPAKGFGGTADIVIYARQQEKNVIQLNPDSREMTRHGDNVE